jgi:hypothetical protein
MKKKVVTFLTQVFDEDGFTRIDQCIYSIKNPEKGSFQFNKVFFSRSRIMSITFMFHAITYSHKLVPMSVEWYSDSGQKNNPFLAALKELTNDCKWFPDC